MRQFCPLARFTPCNLCNIMREVKTCHSTQQTLQEPLASIPILKSFSQLGFHTPVGPEKSPPSKPTSAKAGEQWKPANACDSVDLSSQALGDIAPLNEPEGLKRIAEAPDAGTPRHGSWLATISRRQRSNPRRRGGHRDRPTRMNCHTRSPHRSGRPRHPPESRGSVGLRHPRHRARRRIHEGPGRKTRSRAERGRKVRRQQDTRGTQGRLTETSLIRRQAARPETINTRSEGSALRRSLPTAKNAAVHHNQAAIS